MPPINYCNQKSPHPFHSGQRFATHMTLRECEGNVAHYWPYAMIKSRGVSIILTSSTLMLISMRIEIATFK